MNTQKQGEVNWKLLLICVGIGAIIWFIPAPAGLETDAWHLFSIFVATIVALVIKPIPMGSTAILALTVIALTQILTLEQSLSGFQNTTIWLIVIAFFISRGFIKTGLGTRVSYLFVRLFGKKTLGLSYSMLLSDLILAPAMPSNTARAGGIIFPIIRSLSETYDSRVGDGTERRIGSFLVKVSFQGDMITSAMFVTAMAANPLAVQITQEITGETITWGGWALAALVPGLISLALIPFVIYKLYPPELKETPEASAIAVEKLKEMGPMKKEERYMIGVFVLLLSLWIFGGNFGISATTSAFVGLCVLLLSGVLTWSDIKKEQGAWDTLVWFSVLVMMATYLNELGMIPWFSDLMGNAVGQMSWMMTLVILAIVYFYSHYFFASNTAHVSAMYAAFLSVIVASGAPPLLSALILAFFSNLFSCLTHYGAGPAPVFFGSGYVSQKKWWSLGFIISLIHIVVWFGAGGLWWKALGLW
ncbi:MULTISPECIES: anion permease [unclassified Planococcus (in: firmicutes)]|uniref:anion permease n=1 Tax=unclassified Planococcus (in: firmicutes) TaxID=2662419 RepID=UPI000C32B74B|nr:MULTISPECIES: anion permease [unclassified Planococcus (in: firmicutes)]AUD15008.1 anion permease [Planococcus sp. MB-3u-03]PKG47053.1 anion permease [Planococcus sp. Urea-trap-24]PKG87818.1 anion permease [Planococcus sp. Urea-3u-39]PKH35476.1 anion permease [Planococcus sp. MB-3u-09]